MRVLITVKPQMYREALAVVLHKHRPDDEVVIAPPDAVEGGLADFVPDLLVRNDTDGASPEALDGTARIEVLYSDGMDARVVADGRVQETKDISVDDLLRAVDEVEGLVSANVAKR